MWRCLVFVVAVSIWNPAVDAVPQGDNTCQGVVKHPVKVKVNVTEPVTFRTYTWCLRVPPRCSKYIVQMRERVKEQIEMHNRTITVCCRGYVEMESKCVPACPPMTECPYMHCNRTNHCYCSPGYSGVFCNDPCPKGSWGRDCKKPCDCPDGFTCHHLTGDCMLDDKPSVKTTVRRAFTHNLSESIPTTLKPITTTTERTAQTSSIPSSTSLKITSLHPTPTTLPTTSKPITRKGEPFIPNEVTNYYPPIMQTLFPSSTTTTSTTTTTMKPTIPTVKEQTSTVTTSRITTTRPQKIINLEAPTTATHSSSQENTNMPPIDPFAASNDKLLKSYTTKATVTVKPFQFPEIVTVPLLKINEGINLGPASNIPIYVDQKTSIIDNNHFSPTEGMKENKNDLPFTQQPFSETKSQMNIPIDPFLGINKAQNEIPVTTAMDQFQNYREPSELTTEPILLRKNASDMFTIVETTTRSFPNYKQDTLMSTSSFSKLPEVTTRLEIEDKENSFVVSTATPPAQLDNLPVTHSVDSPVIPMQTPNRNWNPFIPSPGSTKSHGSLTVPFSVNYPVTELVTTEKTDTPMYASAKTSDLENEPKIHIIPSFTEGNKMDLNPTTSKPLTIFTRTSVANTFLHSFLEPSDTSTAAPERTTQSTSLPLTEHYWNPVTFKKPPSVGSDVEHEQTFPPLVMKEKFLISSPSITPPFFSSVNNLKDEETVKLQDNKGNKFLTALYKELTTEPTTHFITSTVFNNNKESLTDTPPNFLQTSHFSSEATSKITQKKEPPTTPSFTVDTIKEELQTTVMTSKSDVSSYEDSQQFTTQGLLDKSPDIETENNTSMKTTIPSYNYNPRIISADKSVNPSMVESVNILNRNSFVSVKRPKPVVESFPKITTPVVHETESGINQFSSTNSIISSTYSHFHKTVTNSEILRADAPRTVSDNVATNRIDFENTQKIIRDNEIPVTTPLTPKEMHHIVNGKLLEEPSNYLPTINDKSTTVLKDVEMRDKITQSTKDYVVTQPPHSVYLPTDKDFLNLTYILNSINDFTSNSKRGMKQSKTSIYGNPVKVKLTENPALNNLVTNAVYDREPSTEMFRPVSVYPTRKHWKQDANRGLHPHKEKTVVNNDSKIIHLNISSPLSFHNPTTRISSKFPSQDYRTTGLPYSKPVDFKTTPIDGRITTVSIISTVPVIKYQTKRSTKEYSQKTDIAFNVNLPPEGVVSSSNIESSEELSLVTAVYSPSKVTPPDLKVLPTVPMQPASESEEISKKPFRRKDSEVSYDKPEDVRPNMTAALAAHSSEKKSHVDLTTGIVATVTSILLLGSLTVATVIIFVYCKKEKPVPMESCIMAYEQTVTPDPTAIYSVPRPSLLPEIFFCPTFSHHYAAQINKEFRELSYGTTKKENSEPVYTEISNDATTPA